MKNFSYLFFLILFPLTLQAQSPYSLNADLEPRLVLGTFLLDGGVSLLERDIEPLSLEEVLALDPIEVNKFDRPATDNWRPKVASYSDIGLSASVLLPLTLGLENTISKQFDELSLLWIETLGITYLVTNLTKVLVKRKRPYVYNSNLVLREAISTSDDVRRNARLSFFSGHTSITAAMSFLFAQTYNDFYPDDGTRYVIWSGAALLPAAIGIMRVLAGRHYPSDVIVGYIVGAAVGILVPRLHRVF